MTLEITIEKKQKKFDNVLKGKISSLVRNCLKLFKKW